MSTVSSTNAAQPLAYMCNKAFESDIFPGEMSNVYLYLKIAPTTQPLIFVISALTIHFSTSHITLQVSLCGCWLSGIKYI